MKKVYDKALKQRHRVGRGKEIEFFRYPIFPPDILPTNSREHVR